MSLRACGWLLVVALLTGGCVPDFSPFTVVDDAGTDGAPAGDPDAGP